jgi:hypothetical protein
MDMGKEELLSTHHIWKGLVKNKSRDSGFPCCFSRGTGPTCVRSSVIPLFFQGVSSQERQKGKEGIPQSDVLASKDLPTTAFGKQET